MSALLIVRAVVSDLADRARFDHWYRTEHLPDALKAFNATSALRGWSKRDPAEHVAIYRFASTEAAEAASVGPGIAALAAEFDRVWGDRVTRTRDIVSIAEDLKSA
jgi:hypothetical protein